VDLLISLIDLSDGAINGICIFDGFVCFLIPFKFVQTEGSPIMGLEMSWIDINDFRAELLSSCIVVKREIGSANVL
jgi:hypothetical protein